MKKIAIVTGASSGIGKEYAERIANEYQIDELWAIARTKSALEQLSEVVSVPVKAISLDLTDVSSGDVLRNLLAEEQPSVQILINASGYGKFEKFANVSEWDNMGMIDLNCRALTQITQLTLPYLAEGGVVVNIASVAAFQPIPYGSVYAASKSYVLSFTRALNRELKKEKKHAIAVCPYWTKTAFLDRSNKQSVITHFDCMYSTKFIVDKSMRAIKKGKRDYIVPGKMAKLIHALTKIMPHKFVMNVFLRQQNLHK